MAKKQRVAPPAPNAQGDGDPGVVPVARPTVDGYVPPPAGEEPSVVYVDNGHGDVAPHLARSARRRVVHVGGVPHQHVSEHEGCWVYRA